MADEGSVRFREIRAERMNMRAATISNGVNLSSPGAPFFSGHAIVSPVRLFNVMASIDGYTFFLFK